MKHVVLLFLLFGLSSPANAFWGATEEEKAYCRNSASGERNQWSAKQTYKYCLKNLKENKKKRIEDKKLKIQKAQKLKKLCERKVKKFSFYKKLEVEKKARDEFKSLSKEERKVYLDGYWRTSRTGYFYGFLRYYFEKYGRESLKYDPDYVDYIREGCEELSIDGYKIKLDI